MCDLDLSLRDIEQGFYICRERDGDEIRYAVSLLEKQVQRRQVTASPD